MRRQDWDSPHTRCESVRVVNPLKESADWKASQRLCPGKSHSQRLEGLRTDWCNHNKNQWGISCFKWYWTSSHWLSLSQLLPKHIKRQRKMIKFIPMQIIKNDRPLNARRNCRNLWGWWNWIQKSNWWPTHILLHDTQQNHPSERW